MQKEPFFNKIIKEIMQKVPYFYILFVYTWVSIYMRTWAVYSPALGRVSIGMRLVTERLP